MDLFKEAGKVKVETINDKHIDWMWGRAVPFPADFKPVLAVTNMSSPLYGILFCNVVKDRFLIGFNHVVKNIDYKTAMKLMERCEPSGRGGEREGAGRKAAPEGAKRRSLTITDEELQYMQEWLKSHRECIVNYGEVHENPSTTSNFINAIKRAKKDEFLKQDKAMDARRDNQVVIKAGLVWYLLDKEDWKPIFYKFCKEVLVTPYAWQDIILATMAQQAEKCMYEFDMHEIMLKLKSKNLLIEQAKLLAKRFCQKYPMYHITFIENAPYGNVVLTKENE